MKGDLGNNGNALSVQQAPELLSMSYDQTSPHNLNHIYKRENS